MGVESDLDSFKTQALEGLRVLQPNICSPLQRVSGGGRCKCTGEERGGEAEHSTSCGSAQVPMVPRVLESYRALTFWAALVEFVHFR